MQSQFSILKDISSALIWIKPFSLLKTKKTKKNIMQNKNKNFRDFLFNNVILKICVKMDNISTCQVSFDLF